MFAYRVGRVQRPHGLEGDLQIQLFRPRRDRSHRRRTIEPIAVALTTNEGDERVLDLVGVRFVDPTRVVLRFDGVDRNEAETLGGRFLDLDVDRMPAALTDDVDQTFGIRVVTEDGADVGEVADVRDNGAQPLLVLETKDGDEQLIPYVDAFVRGIEGEGDERRLVVTPIPGLLDG